MPWKATSVMESAFVVARLLDGEAMMGNSLQQQARFDAFRHEFNTERPTRPSP
jgi:hypothetical protein